jgi:polyisoprenoid-binding protein YceI
MKRIFALCFTTCLAIQVFVPTVAAERRAYVVDRAHSQINFVGEALFISAHGHFDKWDAEIQLDKEKLENSSVVVTVDAGSINTRVQQRDNHLRSGDFLDVAKNPEIKFVATKISRANDKDLVLTGDLSLRGVTRPIQVPVRLVFLREGDARFKGEFQINRQEYGITYNSKMNPVEDMVAIQFDMHLNDKLVMEERQKQARPPAAPQPPSQ